MAKRRDLKKQIHGIMDELCSACLVKSLNVPDTEIKKSIELISDMQDCRKEFISRISHTEPGNVKGFYKKLRDDFKVKVQDFVDTICELPVK